MGTTQTFTETHKNPRWPPLYFPFAKQPSLEFLQILSQKDLPEHTRSPALSKRESSKEAWVMLEVTDQSRH